MKWPVVNGEVQPERCVEACEIATPDTWLCDADGLWMLVPKACIENAASQYEQYSKLESPKIESPPVTLSLGQVVVLTSRMAETLIVEFASEDEPLDD